MEKDSNNNKLFHHLILIILGIFLAIFVIVDFIRKRSFTSQFTLIIISLVYDIFAVINIIFSIKGYKWENIILGKDFKNQVFNYFYEHTNYTEEEKKQIIKKMKKTYRRTGYIIDFFNDEYLQTPYRIWHENNLAFNYGNSFDKQKISYLLFSLHLNMSEDSPLFEFLQYISFEPFSYDEFSNLIKNCIFLSDDMKKAIINDKSKEIFEFFKSSVKSDDYLNKLNFYRDELSESLISYSDKIIENCELVCLMEFFEETVKNNLPDSTTQLFISNDNTKRICIYPDKTTMTYKIQRGEFVFFDTEQPLIYSEGQWICINENSSYFQSEELAINFIKNELEDYRPVTL